MTTNIVLQVGLLRITEPVVTTWALMLVMTISAWVVSRRLALEPRPWQVAVEGTVETIQGAIAAVAPEQASVLLPFIATLWLFIGSANLLGVIPGLSAPTGHLSVTAALALLVFGSVHWFGIRAEGLRGHLGHYVTPTPLMLPFYILSELSRTVALAVRLFGNIMSLEMAALLVLIVAGFLVPVPLLALHIIEAVLQAYIFGMLALIYIAGALQSHEQRRQLAKD
ncbi:ATP synthase subunit a [Nitrospira sp.]|nr:ATP synthase subunit a [Nitrospira sp.]